jgi:hypothetical protein
MNTQSKLYRTLQALLITGISIFAFAPAHAENPVQVTADNYVRAEIGLSDESLRQEPQKRIVTSGAEVPLAWQLIARQ